MDHCTKNHEFWTSWGPTIIFSEHFFPTFELLYTWTYMLIVSVYILHPYCGRYIWSDFYSDPSEHICALNFIPIVLRALVISCWSGQITTHIFLHIVFGFSQIFMNIIYVGRYIWSMSFNLKWDSMWLKPQSQCWTQEYGLPICNLFTTMCLPPCKREQNSWS